MFLSHRHLNIEVLSQRAASGGFVSSAARTLKIQSVYGSVGFRFNSVRFFW